MKRKKDCARGSLQQSDTVYQSGYTESHGHRKKAGKVARKINVLHKEHEEWEGVCSLMMESMENPFMSQPNCSGENFLASAELWGQEKCPSSTHFVRRRHPAPSQRNPLILLTRLPQKRNRVSGTKRGRWYRCSIMAVRVFMP